MSATEFQVIGHRGARFHASDNSDAGFQYLVNNGIGWAETDLRLNGAGEIVLVHDPHLQNGTPVLDGTHRELERLPAILDRYPTLNLNLELKETAVLDALSGLQALKREPHRFILSSFHHRTVVALKQRFPAIPCLLVQCGDMVGLADYVNRLGVDGVVLEYEFVDETEIRRILDQERRVYLYTVNTPADARAFRQMGAHGVISDDPVHIRDTLKGVVS